MISRSQRPRKPPKKYKDYSNLYIIEWDIDHTKQITRRKRRWLRKFGGNEKLLLKWKETMGDRESLTVMLRESGILILLITSERGYPPPSLSTNGRSHFVLALPWGFLGRQWFLFTSIVGFHYHQTFSVVHTSSEEVFLSWFVSDSTIYIII